MCIIFIAINQHPDFPVIICANRDEFHQRTTAPLHFWPEEKIWAGKDLQAGGSWLTLAESGRFSALTNFRHPQSFNDKKRSRGELVLAAQQLNNDELSHMLNNNRHQYNPFNYVYGSLQQLHYYESYSRYQQQLATGLYAICNGHINDNWPKMQLGKQRLAQLISQKASLSHDNLREILQNTQQAQEKDLPKTGIPILWEQMLSAIYITSPEYGTRSSTIITLSRHNNITISETSYNAQAQITGEVTQGFNYTKSIN